MRLVKGQSQNKDTKANSSAVASGVFKRDFMGVGRRRDDSRTQEGKRQWGMAGNQPEWGGSPEGGTVKGEDDLGKSLMTQIFENTVMKLITLCVNYYFKKLEDETNVLLGPNKHSKW